MAERAPLFISADGWPDSFDKTADHMAMAGLTIGGATYQAGNIVLNNGVVAGLAAADANGEALSYNQSGAKLNGLNVDSGNLSLANNAKITGVPTPTDPGDAINKAYADNIANNVRFKGHVSCLKMVDNQLTTAPTLGTGDAGKAYVVAGTGGGWSGFAMGDIVEWDGSAWHLLTVQSGGEPPDGVRVIVDPSPAAGSSFEGHAEDVGEYDADTDTWSFTDPVAGETRAVQNISGDSIYEFLAYTWDAQNSEWVLHNGAGQANAGSGMTKDGNTLNVGGGEGIVTDASYVNIDLATNPGLALTGTTPDKKLELLLKSADELAKDASGLYVVGLPSLFKVGGVATNASVGATALNTLTGGGNADSEHVHAHSSMTGQTENDHHNRLHDIESVTDHSASGLTAGHALIADSATTFSFQAIPGVNEAKRVENAWTAGEALTKGDPVYVSTAADGNVLEADASADAEFLAIGVATTTMSATDPVDVLSHGLAEGLITGLGFTRGQEIYLASGGGLVNTVPSSAVHVVRIGIAKNANDLYVDIHDYGKKPV